MKGETKIAESIALGLLELSPVPLSAAVVASNFDVNADRVEELFLMAESEGFVEHLGAGFYEITEEGSDQVEIRSSRLSDAAISA